MEIGPKPKFPMLEIIDGIPFLDGKEMSFCVQDGFNLKYDSRVQCWVVSFDMYVRAEIKYSSSQK